MDFNTIKTRMEAKDGTGYKNVREIYADVRLVFTNAMTYNGEKNEYHIMAKTLLRKFEDKWLHLLPMVLKEVKVVFIWSIFLHSVIYQELNFLCFNRKENKRSHRR